MEPTAAMDEQAWRATLSVLLDGEEPPVPMAAIMAHLSSCASCSEWLDRAMAVNRGLRTLPVLEPELGERVVNTVDVHLCGCRTGGECLCADCQCGPDCTCHRAAG